MKLKLFATLGICGMMLLSCNDEKFTEDRIAEGTEGVLSKTQSGTVEFKDGTFHFSTLTAFEEFSNKLLKEEAFRHFVADKYGKDLLVGKIGDPNLSEKHRHILGNVPSQYPFILNNSGAYVLEDKYVVFGLQSQYVVDINKKDQFDWNNEENIDRSQLKAFRYGRRTGIIKASNVNARLDIGLNQKHTGGAQHEFTQQTPVSGARKWVDEIDALDIRLGTARDPSRPWDLNFYDKWECVLVFKAKLEYKSGGSWLPAGNNRTITPDILYSLTLGPSPTNARTVATNERIGPVCCVSTTPVPVTGTTDWQFEKHYTYVDTFGQHVGSMWYLTGSGTIKHEIVGDNPSNIWIRSIAW
ncbi:hypothetical protein [Dyadobacter sp. 676]|uniref:Uncharacterized protein n=1 Tax=Dyadobacter sp. 676 TaxID=3088362 RepID=A0AAU8FP31_9BACT